MTKEDKRNLLCRLLAERSHGDGPAKLAKWIPSSPSAIYLWMKPGGPWPRGDKEARMWAFFEYDVDERGNPSPKKAVHTAAAPPAPALPSVSATPAYVSLSETLKDLFTRAPEWEIPMTAHIQLIWETVSRQNTDEPNKNRQSDAVPKNR